MDKNEARKLIKTKRAQLDDAFIKKNSETVFEKIKQLPQFKSCSDVLVYVSYNKEVYTHDFIKYCIAAGKNVYVPKVYGNGKCCENEMKFIRINSFDELLPGAYNILEPVNDSVKWSKCVNNKDGKTDTVMIMPGTAFDMKRHRAGYGGGFYDRFLEKNPGIFKAAVAFDLQILQSFETDEYDICPDIVVTEQRII